jgi:hypothetical protein
MRSQAECCQTATRESYTLLRASYAFKSPVFLYQVSLDVDLIADAFLNTHFRSSELSRGLYRLRLDAR